MRRGVDGEETIEPEKENLPEVVTGIGKYRTRDGHTAVVKRIVCNDTDAYPVKGHIVQTRSGVPYRQDFACWTRAGRISARGPNFLDIVERRQK